MRISICKAALVALFFARTVDAQYPTYIDLGAGIRPSALNNAGFVSANYTSDALRTTGLLYVPGTGVLSVSGGDFSLPCVVGLATVGETGIPYGRTFCRVGPATLCPVASIGPEIEEGSRVMDVNLFGDLVGRCSNGCGTNSLQTFACARFAGDQAATYFRFNSGAEPENSSVRASAISPRFNTTSRRFVVGLAGDEVVNGSKQANGFVWTAEDGMKNIDDLIGMPFVPEDVSPAGDVAGYVTAGGVYEASVFNSITDVLTPLRSFGGPNSRATALNDFGQVVGTAQYAGGEYRAFVMYAYGGLIGDLNWVNPNSAFVMTEATDINENGDIVGVATNVSTGQEHGFALLQRSGFPFLAATGSCARRVPKAGKNCEFRIVVNDFFGRPKKSENVVLMSSLDGVTFGAVRQFKSSSSRKGKTVSARVRAPSYYKAFVVGVNGRGSSSNIIYVGTR